MAISSTAPRPVWHSPIPKRGGMRLWPAVLVGVGFAVALVPAIGGGLSYVVDRFKNSADAEHELKLRSKYYANQIAQVLNIDPASVTAADFAKAAEINPGLAKIYNEVRHEQAKENRSSLMINGGVTAANFVPIPGAGALAKLGGEGVKGAKMALGAAGMAKLMIATMGGGAVAGALSKDEIKAQELIEALDKAIMDAREKGVDVKEALAPHLIFLARVAQDDGLSEEIAKTYGKKPHKMTTEEINKVMDAMPTLANATLREAHAIANGDMSVRDLSVRPPNLMAGHAAKVANDNQRRGSFAAREAARRTAQTATTMQQV